MWPSPSTSASAYAAMLKWYESRKLSSVRPSFMRWIGTRSSMAWNTASCVRPPALSVSLRGLVTPTLRLVLDDNRRGAQELGHLGCRERAGGGAGLDRRHAGGHYARDSQ